MRRRWILPGLLSAGLVAAGAAAALTGDGKHDEDGALVAATSQVEPVDGTAPSSTAPPVYDDYESMCPGLDLDPELIPPYFETHIGLIPDPEPFEICLLLAEVAEARVDIGSSEP